MPDVDRWVRFAGSELLFIYGEDDPWSAERFEPGRWTRDTHVYTAPGARHNASIAMLAEADRAEATATVLRWAGQPGPAPSSQRQAAPEENDEVVAGRP
jgi:PS-10 peptidase S37